MSMYQFSLIRALKTDNFCLGGTREAGGLPDHKLCPLDLYYGQVTTKQ